MHIKVFVLGPYQSNCYVLYKDFDAMLVDPGYPSNELYTFLSSKGLVVKVVYITHGHIDHVGGVNFIKNKFPNAIIYAPLKDRYWYSKNPQMGLHEDVKVDTYVQEDDDIFFANMRFKVLETPGHSYGSTCLYSEGVLFSGDTLFYQSVGRTDLYMGNEHQLIQSIKRLYNLPGRTVVYPGHGEVTSIAFEKKHNLYVKGV